MATFNTVANVTHAKIPPAQRERFQKAIRVARLAAHSRMSDEDYFVREWAAHALQSIGPAAADAVPPLTEALLDDEPSVRQAACEALQSC
jgi:HEAT repeat protein